MLRRPNFQPPSVPTDPSDPSGIANPAISDNCGESGGDAAAAAAIRLAASFSAYFESCYKATDSSSVAQQGGDVFVGVVFDGDLTDLPVAQAAVVAALTAHRSVLCKEVSGEPSRCCGISLSSGARCGRQKSENGETCKQHVAQSSSALLSDHANRLVPMLHR